MKKFLSILFAALFVSGVVGGLSGAHGVAVAFTVSDVIVAIVLVVFYFAKGGKLTRPNKIKEIFVPAVPVTAMRIFAGLVTTLIAFLLPLRLVRFGMTGAEATAAYGRIAGMANPLLLAPNALIGSLAVVLIPEMSINGAKKQFDVLNRQLNAGLCFAFLIAGLFMTVYLSLGQELTTLLYDDTESGLYLQYASYVMIPMVLSQLTQSALNSIGKEGQAFLNYFLGNLALVVAVVVLPQYIGVYAVAVATFVSLLITAVLNVYALRKQTGFPFLFLKRAVSVLLFVFPSAFLSDSIHSLLPDNIFTLGLSALVGALSYTGLCFATDAVDIKGFLRLRKKREKTA